MRSKSMFLMIACVCGAIAAVGASQLMQAQGTGTGTVSMTEVFVATRVINQSEEIKAEMMALEAWPSDRIPPGATNDLEKIEGKFAAQKLYAGEPIINEKLSDEASDLTVAIPKGFSVVSMKADAASSVANLVRPGDRVNVMAYFTKSELIPETGVRTVLTGVKVFAVDGRTTRGDDAKSSTVANTVSLLIDKEDEEAWTLASELGRIRLSLGRPAESGSLEANESGGQVFLKWMSDYQSEQATKAANGKPVLNSNVPASQNGMGSKKRAEGFKMLKLHGDQWTEYEFIDGKQVPVVKSSSGHTESGIGSIDSEPAELESGYSYLNGSQSPFFEPADGLLSKPAAGPSQVPAPLRSGTSPALKDY